MVLKAPFAGVLLASLAAMGQAPGHTATSTVLIRVEVAKRTSLHVSTSQLRFDVIDENVPPRVVIDYTAAARTRVGGDVILTVEPMGEVRTPDGEPVRGLVVGFDSTGRHDRTLAEGAVHVAEAWTGSGARSGQIVFTLLGARKPGLYLLDLKFALSVP